MLNKNAKKWVAALRSGKYKQTRHVLRDGDRMCCLGVACDLYGKEFGIEWESADGGFYFLERENILPSEVSEWIGCASPGTNMRDARLPSEDKNYDTQLCAINDRGATFAEIADIIESEPEGLFVK